MHSYSELKKSALKKYFGKMNPEQQEAVFSVNGPVLVLSGAGSGKTTVIVNRIANMVTFGNAYYDDSVQSCSPNDMEFLEEYIDGKTEDLRRLKSIVAVNPVKSWNILAITFTNKAAKELKSRLEDMLGEDGLNVHASTFHSACVRILRQEIEQLGYYSNFTIYDADDALRVIKSCLTDLNISDKMFPAKMIMNEISNAKDRILSPAMYAREAADEGDFKKAEIAKVYKEYQKRLELANAIDFDDIISLTVELFQDFPDVLEKYQNRYKYIMVDEYQDTNMAQFELIRLLSDSHKNLCVVGDDDQSIYKFRGATIENILGFEKQFENSKVIRLEQNYRSTQNILDAANSVIRNNQGRKEKSLWSDLGTGEKIRVFNADNEHEEASFIAGNIMSNVRHGGKFSDNAVLYRMNAQSNIIERVFASNGIPYAVFGGLRFYDRKEIKDITSYLAVINNNNDILRLKRIINEPKRGIGEATISAIEQVVLEKRISPIEAMKNAAEYKQLSKKANALSSIGRFFELMTEKSKEIPLDELLDIVLDKSGYADYMRNMGDEGISRLENINELKSSMIDYTQRNSETASLAGFLEEISLYTDMDKYNQNDDRVVMMTIHSAKGLEFPNVFIAGMEEGIFPGTKSLASAEDIEEERRLAYVALTRAKNQLYISHASQRMLFGTTARNRKSRFLEEISDRVLDCSGENTVIRKSAVTSVNKTSSVSLSQQIKNNNAVSSKPVNTENIRFNKNDRVSHPVFGEGIIISLQNMGNDTLMEIEFAKVGKKKLMANFAKIKKI